MAVHVAGAVDGPIFVFRVPHNRMYVAPTVEMAVSHVRKHWKGENPPANVAEFLFLTTSGQQLTLVDDPNGQPVGLVNLERIALEDRVWDVLRANHGLIDAAKDDSDHAELLQAILDEAVGLEELTGTLAELSASSGSHHVQPPPPPESGPPHPGTPLHNLCHALHICS